MTIHYPDISNYQRGLSLRGALAAMAKATEGSTYKDPTYAGFKAQAVSLGIPFAAYHWVNTTDVAAQARNAFGVVGAGVPVMWDAEANGSTVPRLLALTQAYRALGGKATLVYLPRWWWQKIGSPDLRPLAAAGLGLVASSYPSAGYTEGGSGWAPYGGVAPVIWQWSSSFVFNGQPVDINAFRGTVAELRSLFTSTPVAQGAAQMEQLDRLSFQTPNNTDRRVGNVLTDLDNLRDYLLDGSDTSASPVPNDPGYPRPGSLLGRLSAFLAEPLTLTDAQMDALGQRLGVVLAAAYGTKLDALGTQLSAVSKQITDLRAQLASGAQATHDALTG